MTTRLRNPCSNLLPSLPLGAAALGILLMAAWLPAGARAQAPPASGASARVLEGQALFNGTKAFSHGGPACSVCHSVDGGHGGTEGPNLTQMYKALGASGIDTVLTTLPVAAMRPVYQSRPVNKDEQDALNAFFAATERPGGEASIGKGGAAAGASAAAAAPQTPAAPPPPPITPAEFAALATQGEKLFTGQVAFANRGPACIACHSVGGLPFPNGGTVGPNLTHIYNKMGAIGVASALQTLFFPAMMPLYDTHPLTPPEQRALLAFFQQANQRNASTQGATEGVVGYAVLAFIIFMLITGILGRKRLKGVRRRLMASARTAPRRAETLPAPGPGAPNGLSVNTEAE